MTRDDTNATDIRRRGILTGIAGMISGAGCLKLTQEPPSSTTITEEPTTKSTPTASPTPTPAGVQPAAAYWTVNAATDVVPVFVDGHVLLGKVRQVGETEQQVKIQSLNAQSGQGEWQYTSPSTDSHERLGGIVTNSGAVFVSSIRHTARLDPSTGEASWKRDFGTGRVLTVTDTLLVLSGVRAQYGSSTMMVGLSTADGSEAWRTDVGERPYSRTEIATANGVAAFATDSGSVIGVSLETGDKLWTYSLAQDLGLNDVATDGKSIFATGDAAPVVALDPNTGQRRWKQETRATNDTGGSAPPRLAADGTRVYLSANQISAFSVTDGAPMWAATYLSHGSQVIPADDGYLYCYGDTDVEKVFQLNPKTGRASTKYPTPFRPQRYPAGIAVGDRSVFVQLYPNKGQPGIMALKNDQ